MVSKKNSISTKILPRFYPQLGDPNGSLTDESVEQRHRPGQVPVPHARGHEAGHLRGQVTERKIS